MKKRSYGASVTSKSIPKLAAGRAEEQYKDAAGRIGADRVREEIARNGQRLAGIATNWSQTDMPTGNDFEKEVYVQCFMAQYRTLAGVEVTNVG